MSRQKSRILIYERVLNREPVPLMPNMIMMSLLKSILFEFKLNYTRRIVTSLGGLTLKPRLDRNIALHGNEHTANIRIQGSILTNYMALRIPK